MTRLTLSRAELVSLALLLIYTVVTGYFVLTSHYLFSDEAYVVWHMHDSPAIFDIFHSQGRSLGGLFLLFLFRHFGTVAGLPIIRVVSLAGWLVTVLYLFFMLRRCVVEGTPGINRSFAALYTLFTAASLSFAIYTGWAVCAEAFVPALAALYAGFSLHRGLRLQPHPRLLSRVVYLKVVLAGLVSLFFYQSLYPLMLLPFFIAYVSHRDKEAFARLRTAVVVHLIIYLLYYGLFVAVLKMTHTVASNRTSVSHDVLRKIGFFFSFPLNQAFNLNIPFNTSGILSQAAFPVLAIGWIVWLFVRDRQQKASAKLRYLLVVAGCWMLSFLPQLIAQENFGPYRTMLPLSLLVFITLAAIPESLLKTAKARQLFAVVFGGLLLLRGLYNYVHFIARPLAFEYDAIQSYALTHYSPAIRRIVVIRPGENGFASLSGMENYKDEFGMPSSAKDWVPEGLIKQVLLEKGVGLETLQKIPVDQYTEETRAEISGPADPGVLLMDIPAILKERYARNGYRFAYRPHPSLCRNSSS